MPNKPSITFDRIIVTLVCATLLFITGYQIGLAVGLKQAIPHDSTPLLDASSLSPDRFIVTYRDTLESGLVIEVVNDLIWHNATITVKYFGNELATATIDK